MAARAIVILIAIWSVIQGFAYGIMSILALLAHNCQIPRGQSKIEYLIYIIFFWNGDQTKCERVDWSRVADFGPLFSRDAWVEWPEYTQVAFRTNILAVVYLVLSTVWIITSLMLIVGCFMTCLGRVTYYLLMMPWAIFCTLTSILDVVAVGFFFYDLFNTLNTESFIAHLQLKLKQDTDPTIPPLLISANILPIPAVIMLVVASRGFIFWCFNILSIPVVLAYEKNILYGSKRSSNSDDRDFQYTRSHTHGNDNILENHFPTTERSRYSDPTFYHQYQYDNMSYQKDKNDMGRSNGRQYIEPIRTESIDEPDNHMKRTGHSRNSSHGDRSSKKSAGWSDEDSGNSNSTVHLTPVIMASNSNGSKHNHGKSYNWKEMPADAVLKIERPHFRLPHKSSLLKKLSDSSYVMTDDQQQQQQQQQHEQHQQQSPNHHQYQPQYPSTQYTGDELRGQLPWSYFGARSEVVKPKKSFIELRDDEDTPPVPDYTIKFSPKERVMNTSERRPIPAKKFINPKKGSTGRNLDRSHWSGPEYRY